MPVDARSDELESRLHPFPGARPPPQGQSTAGARLLPTASVTEAKVSSGQKRGSRFSSYNASLQKKRRLPRERNASLGSSDGAVLGYCRFTFGRPNCLRLTRLNIFSCILIRTGMSKGGVFHQAKIPMIDRSCTQRREAPWSCSQRKGGKRRECILVEPLLNTGVARTIFLA